VKAVRQAVQARGETAQADAARSRNVTPQPDALRRREVLTSGSGLGNQTVLRRIALPGRAMCNGTSPPPLSHAAPALRRKCAACGGEEEGLPGVMQPKLLVGTVDDPLEREADRAADAVMRMGDHAPAEADTPVISPTPLSLRRACAACQEEDKLGLRRKEAPEAEHRTSREVPPIVQKVLRSPGQPLDAAARAFFEPRFGRDLTTVRIHADSSAEASAASVGALSYTVGTNIAFGAGQYAPHSAAGRHLLAHELAHVVQQSGDMAAAPVRRRAASALSADDATTLRRQTEAGEQTAAAPGASQTTGAAGGGDDGQPCPPVPTGLGDIDPDPPCPSVQYAGTTELTRLHFCPDSDRLTPTERMSALDPIVTEPPRSARFLVHGHASSDGDAAYNFRLSCHRAHRVAEAIGVRLRAALQGQGLSEDRIEAEIGARVEVGSRGATSEFPGGAAANRVVLVYGQIPGADIPEEPSCAEAPRHIGDIKPEPGCDPPTLDLASREGSPQLRHFHFCLDSDVLSGVDPSDIAAFAFQQAAGATFVIHGFASIEGKADYNQRLSCHRALRIARELMESGVLPEQIREVSGLGKTDRISGGPEFNRVAIVLAEGGRIGDLQEQPLPADTLAQKNAIVEAARSRLRAGQYRLEADAYISLWTCGRTPTVRQAVERLTVLTQDEQGNPSIVPNGTEENIGVVNTVRISDVTLRADNPIECTMARLVDMAFHHAVKEDFDLSPDLANASTPAPRHLAGLHLAALAGFSECQGPTGGRIDAPVPDDPRSALPPPLCARPPQPTRLLPPGAGEKVRQAPDFLFEPPVFALGTGSLSTVETNPSGGSVLVSKMPKDGVTASANVQLLGKPEVFADYEIGFTQTVLADETGVEYVTGHRVVEQLPIPIRAAEMKGDTPVPAPWMSATAVARPKANGNVAVSGSSGLHTEAAQLFKYFRPVDDVPGDLIDTWHRRSRIGIWLVAHRLGAPFDHFSIQVLDGFTYDLAQDLHMDLRRVRGQLGEEQFFIGKEEEFRNPIGTFTASDSGQGQPDARQSRLGGASAGEIDLNRQVRSILEPPSATEAGGIGVAELTQIVQQILDNLVLFPGESEMRLGTGGVTTPRLGFVFSPLDIRVLFERRTGRMPLHKTGGDDEFPVTVQSAGMGRAVRFELEKALSLRLRQRDFLRQGRPVILRTSALPGTDAIGEVAIFLEPLQKEPDLSENSAVLRDMAEMWACTELTASAAFLDPREFAAAYWLDRDGNIQKLPVQGFVIGEPQDENGFLTKVPCGPQFHKDAVALSVVHTHPEEDGPGPSDADRKLARSGVCGRQFYVISQDSVIAFFSSGPDKEIGKRKAKLPSGVKCSMKFD
jgi:outer membrane protein OmpA-like peptidoglycan-associated protein